MRMRAKAALAAVAAACAGGLLAASAEAGVVLSDTFTYPDGNLVGQGGWTLTGTSNTNPIQVASGMASLVTTGQDAYKAFSSTVAHTDGDAIYAGFDLNVSAAQATGDYFLHLSDPAGTTFNFWGRVFAKSSGTGYVLGILDTSGTGSSVTYGTTVLDFNTEYRVVEAWNFVSGTNNDTFALYVNPTSYLEGSNTAYATHTWTSTSTAEPAAQLAAANFRQGTASNAPTVKVDDLIVATSFAEAANVPEPAALGLLAAGGLLGLPRRRRR